MNQENYDDLQVLLKITKYLLKEKMQQILMQDFLAMPESVIKFKILNFVVKNKHFD